MGQQDIYGIAAGKDILIMPDTQCTCKSAAGKVSMFV